MLMNIQTIYSTKQIVVVLNTCLLKVVLLKKTIWGKNTSALKTDFLFFRSFDEASCWIYNIGSSDYDKHTILLHFQQTI